VRWLLRGILAALVIGGFWYALGAYPTLLAVALLIAAAAMLWRSWVLASRAEPRR